MPRAKYTAVIDHNTDTGFRAWAKQLSDALKSCLTQTNDTGQVDWSLNNQVRPGTFGFYEIYRFSDPLQATQPVFIRVDYGTGSGSPDRPAVRFSVATATNGAGVLTGVIFVPTNTSHLVPGAANVAPQPATTYVCYKDGTFTLAWCMNATGSPRVMVVVDRTRDSDGAANGRGLLITGGMSSLSGATRCHSYDTNVTAQYTAPPCLMPIDSGSSVNSSALGVVNLYNWYCPTPDMQYVTGVLGYKDREIGKLTEIDVAMVGATPRHYVCLGTDGPQGSALGSSLISDTHAILWEV